MVSKDFHSTRSTGSRKLHEPRSLSEVLAEYFAGNSPLARAYRDRSLENVFSHTEPCWKLKLLTSQSGRPAVGMLIDGIITRDNDSHYTFTETAFTSSVVQRNVHTFDGIHITCTHRLKDGKVRLNFKNLKVDAEFNVDGYAHEVANEIRQALRYLVKD